MKTINGMGRPRSQPPRLFSERDRYTLARMYYSELCAQQDVPAEQRDWFDVDVAMRIVLALFPELVVDHSIAKPVLDAKPPIEFFEFEDGEQPTHTLPDYNIIYLR